jgi:putative transposase
MLPTFYSTILNYLIDEYFPKRNRGRHRTDTALIIEGILYVLRSVCQWRFLLTGSKVSWQTVHRHFVMWSKKGIFEKAYRHLVSFYVNRNKRQSTSVITDCTFIKNVYGSGCVGANPTDRGRKATKLSVMCDDRGVVLAATFHKANKADYKAFLHTLTQSRHVHAFLMGKTFYADRAYDNQFCNMVIDRFNMVNRYSRKGTQGSFPASRVVVEHVFGWLDKYRRIVLRYERSIVHHKSFTYMALSNRILKCL